ncbi:ribonuclease P protein component [Psychrobacter sp. HD31]|uniref:ribonuclease P protein component n=1 Tax=Psychrobacter sp. HD31 TaxID=3112003 RepID=UPI003DA4845D
MTHNGYSYPKTARLLTPKQFKNVFDSPDKKIHQPHLMAFIKKNELNNARLGMAITKKKVPTAVARNQLKRLTRENFRMLSSDLGTVDIVFIVKKPIKDISNNELKKQIKVIFNKIISHQG